MAFDVTRERHLLGVRFPACKLRSDRFKAFALLLKVEKQKKCASYFEDWRKSRATVADRRA